MNITALKRSIPACTRSIRAYSSKAVNVSFDKYALKPSQEPPVLICHGLFGSKQNWTSLAKAMSNRLSRDVYTIVSFFFYQIYFHMDSACDSQV